MFVLTVTVTQSVNVSAFYLMIRCVHTKAASNYLDWSSGERREDKSHSPVLWSLILFCPLVITIPPVAFQA